MCDQCGHTLTDEALRALFYMVLKKVMNKKPVATIPEAITGGVEKIVDGDNSIYTHGDKDIWRKSALYFLASFVYDRLLYERMKEWKLNVPAGLGICPCELIRDLYILVILQLYSFMMHGFKLYPLITDTISVMGAGQIQKIIGLLGLEKKEILVMRPPIAASAPISEVNSVKNGQSNESQISSMKRL